MTRLFVGAQHISSLWTVNISLHGAGLDLEAGRRSRTESLGTIPANQEDLHAEKHEAPYDADSPQDLFAAGVLSTLIPIKDDGPARMQFHQENEQGESGGLQ